MKVSLEKIFLVVILASVSPFSVAFPTHPDFDRAARIVQAAAKQPGNIDYGSFCAARHEGGNKLGCQIQAYKNVGLLVCLRSPSDVCETQLQLELMALSAIRSANLRMVNFDGTIIRGLKCGGRGSRDVTCSGFLEEWIQPGQGEIKAVDGNIRKREVNDLIRFVKGYQVAADWEKTAGDLEKIINFMNSPGGCDGTGYNRICDLQGFFMKTGGFAIGDPEGVEKNEGIEYQCYDPSRSPTTRQVLNGLQDIVDALRAGA